MTLPTMILNADGTTADADREALALLGVTRDQPVSLPPGAFSPEPPDPDEPDIGGEATIRRLDGWTADWRAVRHDIDVFRRRYQAMFTR